MKFIEFVVDKTYNNPKGHRVAVFLSHIAQIKEEDYRAIIYLSSGETLYTDEQYDDILKKIIDK